MKTVFANLITDLENLHKLRMGTLKGLVDKLTEDFKAVLQNKETKGLRFDVVECQDDVDRLELEYKSRVNIFNGCSEFGIRTQRIQDAEICWTQQIKYFRKEEEKRRINTRNCILKHFVKDREPYVLL
ncbi:uncharacterized protein LOC117170798 [Belonocnema kinseyi]|uniref:uncharacterized protein LOC117170798 n=1 Tax=Belonocnema kinseyi TaxID=2817044 RepID=UPI00143DB4F4|nr:uncharacterized protein LOC117170798 [Belonocnema kinseyi]